MTCARMSLLLESSVYSSVQEACDRCKSDLIVLGRKKNNLCILQAFWRNQLTSPVLPVFHILCGLYFSSITRGVIPQRTWIFPISSEHTQIKHPLPCSHSCLSCSFHSPAGQQLCSVYIGHRRAHCLHLNLALQTLIFSLNTATVI